MTLYIMIPIIIIIANDITLIIISTICIYRFFINILNAIAIIITVILIILLLLLLILLLQLLIIILF